MTVPSYERYRDTGLNWLGSMPGHWRIEKFRYLFSESSEKIGEHVVGPMLSVSGYRGIEIKEYDDENRRRTDDELIGYRIVRAGQLVVNTMWLNYAGLGVSDYEGHVSPAYRSYYVSAEIDRRYAHYLLRSSTYVAGYTRLLTGVRPNSLQMSRDDLMSFPVFVPPHAEQCDITAFLDRETAKIDALVEEQKRLIELLKEKRQAVISQAVTKGLNPNVSMKDSGVEWLGKVPAHWRVAPLKHVVHLRSGGTPDKSRRDFWDGDVPWASAKDLKSDALTETVDHITDAALLEGAATLVDMGVVLVVVRGMILARTFPVTIAKVKTAINQDLKAVSMRGPGSNGWLAWLLRASTLETLSRLDEAGHGTKALRMEAWGDMRIAVPELAEQQRIASFLEAECRRIDDLVDVAEHAIDLLRERRSAVISAAVTGKIDVRALVPPPEAMPA